MSQARQMIDRLKRLETFCKFTGTAMFLSSRKLDGFLDAASYKSVWSEILQAYKTAHESIKQADDGQRGRVKTLNFTSDSVSLPVYDNHMLIGHVDVGESGLYFEALTAGYRLDSSNAFHVALAWLVGEDAASLFKNGWFVRPSDSVLVLAASWLLAAGIEPTEVNKRRRSRPTE